MTPFALTAQTFLGHLWKLTQPYWISEERWRARGLLLALIALTLGQVYLMVLFNAEALRACSLDDFVKSLDDLQPWGQRLSPGEQQRLGFARALLQKPDWLFLDEATAALDEAMEQHLYGLIRSRLPNTTYISIAHRPMLAALHVQRLALVHDGAGMRLVAKEA